MTADLVELFAAARARLAPAPQAALGELVASRRILGVARAPRIEPRGHAWHLGALLLSDDAVYATGEVVRAREEVRRGYAAESQRARAVLAGAARRGGFAEGRVVHIGWTPLDLDAVAAGEPSGPLLLRAGLPRIHWSSAGGYMPLDRYLDERIDLLLHPPTGAT